MVPRLTLLCIFLQASVGWSIFGENAPRLEVGGRVVDLLNGEHFDDVLMDTPNELRPGGIVVFYKSQDPECMKEYDALDFQNAAETKLPARERAFIGKYDIDMQGKRQKTEFTPEQDLPKRFGIKGCPTIVYIPRACNGHTDWCVEDMGEISYVGCESFTEQCKDWIEWPGTGDWVDWALAKIDSEPWPALDNAFGSWKSQGNWIKGRDSVTTNTHMRNNYLAPNLPKFSKTGAKLMDIPDKLQEQLLDFYHANLNRRKNEPWDIHGATQMNFHEVGTDLVYLDLDPYKRDKFANQYLKPILEEWSGTKLKLNAFYGMREYFPGAWLRNHVDRIDTHVISATLSVLKINSTAPWPLETVDWSGKRVRYEHKPGEMILYESSTRPHGRPYPMSDGVHVGCFVHFSPVDDAVFTNKVGKGRRALASASKHITYKSTPTNGPSNPKKVDVIVTPENMGAKGRVRRDALVSESGRPANSIGVEFINDMTANLNLLWLSNEDEAVESAFVEAGGSTQLFSYDGHRFFWSQDEKPDPTKASLMIVSRKRTSFRASEVLQQLKTDL